MMYTGQQRGMDIVGSTSLIYRGEAVSFTWNNHGFKLHLSEGTITSDISECPIHLEAAISGQFQFPDGAELVSGVYCIHSPKQFTKKMTVKIQHFSSSDSQKEIDELCFIFSNTDQLPCQFAYSEDCTFSVGSQYGAIETKSFGKFAIVRRKKKGLFSLFQSSSTSHNLYRSYVLYVKESDSNWIIAHSIIQQAELYSKVTIANGSIKLLINKHYLQILFEKFPRESLHDAIDQQVTFTQSEITLDIPSSGVAVDMWTIQPLTAPVVSLLSVFLFLFLGNSLFLDHEK